MRVPLNRVQNFINRPRRLKYVGMINTDHYIFILFFGDPIYREWYPCDVALPIVSILCTYLKGYGAVLYVPER